MFTGQRFSGYDIIETIEETKGAIFYRGQRSITNETVLIQELKTRAPSPSEMAVFMQEYKTLSTDHFHGVVPYVDLIETRNSLAIIQEDFNGTPLGNVVSNKQSHLIFFLDIAVDILETLGQLHPKNIIHKNITPQSILIHPKTGTVKLTHFGFIPTLTHENDTLHDPFVIRNTLTYFSPEQTGHMNRPIDYRTDIYSLGIVLYELLTGSPPFVMDNPMEMIHAHMARLPVPPDQVRPNVPHIISEIILKLLSKNPEDRYQSCHGVAADLMECREQLKNRQAIESFPLCTHDISLQFNIPQILVGRDKEVALLMAAFDRINTGEKELVLVGGLPGIGKSALINEIRKPVVANKGYFSSGKFDQFTRDIPYSALIQSFKGIIHQILAEGDKKIAQWQKRIRAALGPNGKVMTDVIPALELLIGPQPEIPTLDPEESKNRFNYVFQNLINSLACQEHSLVIFLDDMQWADAASTELIRTVITHHSTRHFLLICAYRSNEIGPAHPFMMTIDDIKKTKIPVHDLSLGPISLTHTNRLVSIALRCNIDNTPPLSEMIHQKTGGNPFFVIQFCKSLYDLGYLESDPAIGVTWDLDRINRMQVTENVVDLMADKISALEENTRNILMTCAAMGNQFNLETLAMVSGQSLEQTLDDLTGALRENLIGMHKDIFRFQHDRIQEAAYSLIPEDKRAGIHLVIGKNMLEKTATEDFTDSVFQIADHLNQGQSLIQHPEEKIQLAELNLTAGEKARNSTAYKSAIAYLSHSVSLLPANHWETHYDMSRTIHMKQLECQSLSLDLASALATFQTIVQHTRGNTDIANAYNLMTYLYTIQGDYEKALRLGIEGMSIVGVRIPKSPGNLKVLWQLIRMRWFFGNTRIEDIPDIPFVTDPEIIAYTNLAVSTTTVAYYVDANLFTYIVVNGASIIPRYGNCEITPFALNAIGSILGSIGLYKQGFRFGETSLKMMDKFTHYPQRGRVLYLFSLFILHTRKHGKYCIENFRKSFTLCLEAGDLIFSLHSISMRATYRIMLGDNLEDILSEYVHYENFQKEGKDPFTMHMYKDNIQLCRCLQGLTPTQGRMDEQAFDEENALEYYRTEDNLIGVFFFRLHQLKLRYLFGEFDECLEYFEELQHLLKCKIAIGAMHIPEFVLYHSLVIAAVYPKASWPDKLKFYTRLRVNLARMKKWAHHCPDNYHHKYLLILAEMYRLKGKRAKAVKHYRLAVQSAFKYGYTQNKAIANERLSTYHLESGENDLATHYLREACQDFEKAGYTAKVNQLRESYPLIMKNIHPKNDLNGKTTHDLIDLETIMQISQAISGEIVLDKLLRLIMDITMKRAGAGRGFLLLENEGHLYVEAESDITQKEVFGLKSIPIENHEGFARSVVHYVARTQKPLLLSNAAATGDFTLDPYILDHQPRSILCLPILNQGRLSAIIYFENTLTANAFKPDHVELLGLLSAQAAVAIDNARLYENLEEKVSQRTNELNMTLQTVENANRQIMGSIRYSAMIQQSLLPDPEMIHTHLPGSFFIWIPRDIVGGDIYHFEAQEDRFIIAVIDGTGHGVPGAFMTMIASSGLRRIIKEENEFNPALILKKLNVFVKTTLQQDKDNAHSDDGLDAAICCYSARTDTLDFAGARLPLYLVKDNLIQKIKGDRKSLGYISSNLDHDYTRHTIHQVKGSHIYMPTDGYSDQLCAPPTERFGNGRFTKLILDHHQKPFEEQKEILMNALDLHRGGQSQTDDITIVGFTV
ncbi:MAG: AAA family ATPase [Proteobacteria bacterium]|nr:AAA family ATPase [Pseudomonadota bacterium]